MTDQTETPCPFTPIYRYTWPGQDERFACFLHAQQLAGLAQAMSFYLQMIPLSSDDMENKHCSNHADKLKE